MKTFLESRVDANGTLATYHQNLAQEYENILITDDDRTPGQWNSLGPVTGTTGVLAELGIVTSLLVIDDQNIYAGTGTAGLFVTNNGGATWRSLTDKYLITGIESIIKIDPDTIYIATGFDTWGKVYGKGILKSEDNGLTWKDTGLNSNFIDGSPFTVKGMIADPDSSGTFYAIVQEENRRNARIVKSVDTGVTWDEKYIQSDIDLRKIEMDPTNSNRIMAAGRELVISNDRGNSWQTITSRIPYQDISNQCELDRITMSFHPTIPDRILVVLKKRSPLDVNQNTAIDFFISNDGGLRFSRCSFFSDSIKSKQFTEDKLELEWSKAHDDCFYIGGLWVHSLRLSDTNVFVNDIGSGYHVDIRYLTTYTIEGKDSDGNSRYLDVLYQGNDGGITKGVESSESGVIWQDISGTGLNITQYYGLGITESDPELYLGGTQDGNLFIHDSTGWHNRSNTGDAADAVIDYNNPANIYMVHFCGSSYLTISKDYGQSWDYHEVGMPNEGWYRRNDGPLEMSKRDPSILFVGGKQVYKSKLDQQGNLVFNKISDFDEKYPYFKTIRVAKNSDNFIIAGRQNAIWGDTLKTARLHLTLNGGADWYNITPIDILDDAGIFDIAIDPKKHNKFYIALDRFNANKKVYKGEWGINGDTTVTWTNMSEGLPNVPVNCIKIYEGSDAEEMFAGTDCGVYYYNKEIGKWIKFGRGMPVCPVSDLEINYYTGQLIASTFGRGMYRAELCEIGPAELTIYIDTIQVWEDTLRIPADIIIQSGGNLTIKGKIQMKYNKSITVHKGAFLTVDGGTITSYCSTEPWSGIKVLGTASGGQSPLYQGVVYLKNGAVIEKARIGVHCLNPEDPTDNYPITGGGIIMANNTTFKNNITAVQFERYTYTSSISFFKNCIFETIGTPLPSYPKKYFVRLNELAGLFFGACTFKNEILVNPFENFFIPQHGIYSVNSHFVVDGQCPTTPCPPEYKSKFENLVYGIYVSSKPGTRTFKVTNSIFTNNDCGIYALSTDNVDIRDNDFNICTQADRATGLYLDHCNGYVVEENEFRLTEVVGQQPSRGIYVNESGPYNNTLYLNKFNSLTYGIVAEGCNRSIDGFDGLQLKCNTFEYTYNDITVLPDSLLISSLGVAKDQGRAGAKFCDQLAGNTFSQFDSCAFHFYNGPFNTVNYYFLRSNNNMKPQKNVRVKVSGEIPEYPGDCCPPNAYGGGGSGTIDMATMEYNVEYQETSAELDSLIDQGETDSKLFTINTAIPDEGLSITGDLLQTSPYVSDTVIKKTIEREDVITNSMLRDIMVANPHSAKSTEMIDQLDARYDPMPQYMKDEILEGQSIESAREHKEAERNLLKRAYEYGVHRQLAQLLTDSLRAENDSITLLLESDGSFNSQLKLAWLSFENGDTLQALNYISSLDTLFELNSIESSEVNSQSDFMQWIVNNPVFDTTQIETLLLFRVSSSHKVSSAAIGILLANDIPIYNEPYSVIDLSKASDLIKVKEEKRSTEYVIVTPNPAKDFITVKYASETKTSDIKIFNEEGKLVLTKGIQKQMDEITLNTRDYKPGVYFIMMLSDKGKACSSKFIITK